MARNILQAFIQRCLSLFHFSPESARSQEHEQYLALLLENVSDAVVAADAQYHLTAWNAAAERMYGWKASEVLGKNGLNIVHTQFANADKDTVLQAIAREGRYQGEATQARKDGTRFAVEVSSIVLRNALGQVSGYVSVNRDISARKAAEEQLRASMERFQALFDNAPLQGVIYRLVRDRQGEIVDWEISDINPPGAASLEQAADQLLGKRALDLFGVQVMEPYLKVCRELAASGQSRQFETHFEVNQRDYLTTVFPIGTQFYANISVDISELKRAERRLQAQLERMLVLSEIDRVILSELDNSPTIVNLLGRIALQLKVDAISVLLLNEEAGQLEYFAGYGFHGAGVRQSRVLPGAGVAGQAWAERRVIFIPDLQGEQAQFSRADLLQGEGFVEYFGIPMIANEQVKGVLEIFNRSPHGSDRDWIDYLVVLAGQVGIAIDKVGLVAKLQQANFELEKKVALRTQELSQANLYLEKANRAKDEFLASMSHELRSPLTGILGISESLQWGTYGQLDEHQLKIIKMIDTAGQHLLQLINDILDVSKYEAGKIELAVETFELGSVCQASLQIIKGMAQQKQQKVAFCIFPKEIMLQGDPRRLKQIVVNLLSNAVKFSPEGSALGLEVTGDAAERLVQISVWDRGVGIRPEDLHKLFQPFVQIDNRLNREHSGTGLGLALVKDLTALMGGSVSVESTFGAGSRFTINLPWVQLAAGSVQAPTSASGGAQPSMIPLAAREARQTCVMVVDDSELNLKILDDALTSAGMQVFTATDGWQALERVGWETPDVILMDIQMPGIDGLETIRRLRKMRDARLAGLPVIAVTALVMPGDREKCLSAGANAYVSKPYSLSAILRLIESMAQPT